MRTNKYTYYKVIQQNWDGQWDDVSPYITDSTGFITDRKERLCFKEDLKEYRNNGVPTRIIKRRELN